MTFILCGRRSIWGGWRAIWFALRTGNDVSYATHIPADIHFLWQAQYLVRLAGDFTCSAHWKWRFICVADRWWPSFCVAGAVFGEVGGRFDLLCALEMMFHMRRTSLLTFIFCGRRSIWWGWRVTLLAPRIGNDISYVTQIADDLYFLWQAQYLGRLEGDFICSAHWKWCFICDAHSCWHSFSVAGAVFGEVGGWFYLLCALEMMFHMRRTSLMTFIFCGRRSIWWGWRVILFAPRTGNDLSYATHIPDDIHFLWQAQYLGRLEGDFTCCAHWKWCFICDAHPWWHSFSVAGAVFGEVGGWHCVFSALEMMFHMWRTSLMTFIFCGTRSIWWGWRVTLLVRRIGNDVSYVT